MTSLDALYYMTGESFYRESCEKRREMLKEIYPVYATRNEDGSVDVSLLRAAAPHPYDISISPTILELLDKDGTVVETLYADTRYYMDNWIRETVTSDVTGYRMYSRYNEEPVAPYLLFEGTIDYLEESDTEAPALQGSWSARNDVGMLEEDTLEIDAERTDLLYGTAFFQIDGDPIPQTPESYWGVELTNTGDETISVSVILYDTEGNSITRYLPSLYPGKNLFLFSHLGFVQSEVPLGEIQEIGLCFYTSTMTKPFSVEIGDVYAFQNTRQVINYWEDTPYQAWYQYMPSDA